MKIEAQPTTSTTAEAAQAKAEARLLLEENGKLRAALEEVRSLVLGANQSKDRYPKTRAALGEKQ